jgi:aryl-alcohol dehydrogenase-like predicted oxidoreductase
MRYRRLGHAGIQLSEIGLGSWLTYGGGVDEAASRKCIRRAFDLGVNFFDTADVYHSGEAEKVYGRELSPFRRQDLVIASKCFFPMSAGINDRGLSRKHIFESVEGSLKRLNTGYIDLYQCHRYDPEVELFEVIRAMDDLIRQGKILYWGVSEWSAEQIREACRLAQDMHAHLPVSNQPEYSLAARQIETNGVQAACVEQRLGMLLWSPLKQGILTGKYSGGKTPADSRAASDEMSVFLKELDRDLIDRVDKLLPLAERNGMTMAQFVISWLLSRDAVTSVIIGATKVAQVEENIASTEFGPLGSDERAAVDRLFPPAARGVS